MQHGQRMTNGIKPCSEFQTEVIAFFQISKGHVRTNTPLRASGQNVPFWKDYSKFPLLRFRFTNAPVIRVLQFAQVINEHREWMK